MDKSVLHKVEQQGYKFCMALLKLTDTYSPLFFEEVCQHAVSYLQKIKSEKSSGYPQIRTGHVANPKD